MEWSRPLIDTHLHYLRPEWAEALWSPELRLATTAWPRLFLRMVPMADPSVIIDAIDARGVERAVIYPEMSVPPGPQIPGGAVAALKLSRAMNDATAALVAHHPQQLIGLAVVNPLGGAADVAELRRAVVALGLRGVAVGSSYRGDTIDAAAARPFLETVQALDVPLVVHPVAEVVPRPPRDFGLDLLVGMPMDLTSLAVRLMRSGTLTTFPRLRIVLPHLGGGLLTLLGWLDATNAPGEPLPSTLAQQFYVDTATATPYALALAVATLGTSQVLYGSDWPLSITAKPGDPNTDPVAMVEKLTIGPTARDAILEGNARRLFG